MTTLNELGRLHGTDKVEHGFCAFYHRHLAARRLEIEKVVEIGVLAGASVRMWHDYFPNAFVHGVDQRLPPGSFPPRIVLHDGDQANRMNLDLLIQRIGSGIDVVIDDGGHTMQQQQVSLAFLFPHVRAGGTYIIEDLHTSFWSHIGVFANGKKTASYSTGAGSCQTTSFTLVESLLEGRQSPSEFISAPEMSAIARDLKGGEIFDRDGNRQHMTALLWKR